MYVPPSVDTPLPIHRDALSPHSQDRSLCVLQSLLLFFRLQSTLLPLAEHNPRPQPWVLYQHCQEDALAVWQALCFHMQFTPCPYPASHDMRVCSQESLQLWMRNNGLVFSETYLGWWRTANPPSQVYQPNSQKSSSDIALAPPPGFFILYSKGPYHRPSFCWIHPTKSFPVSVGTGAHGNLPLWGSFRIPGYQP